QLHGHRRWAISLQETGKLMRNVGREKDRGKHGALIGHDRRVLSFLGLLAEFRNPAGLSRTSVTREKLDVAFFEPAPLAAAVVIGNGVNPFDPQLVRLHPYQRR